MLEAFSFEQGGRTYRCSPERGETPPAGTWWWFTVSSDPQRYAPFQAVAGDTERSIRARIAAFYERRLWARAQPAVPHQSFGRPGKPTGPAKP
ncbi:MAG: hypothetical protein AAB409_05855 [Gemmatimonadota bacterium]